MFSRRKILSTSLVASSAAVLQAPFRALGSPTPDDFAPVKQMIGAAIDQGRATGVAVAVVHGGLIVWEQGFGFADRERRVASTPRTPFSLASITKAFTATLVAALAQKHGLSLDSFAMLFLKESPLQGPNGDPKAVTIRMLGSHCSGLPGSFTAHLLGGAAPAQRSAAFLSSYGRLAYPPGQLYEYCNIGFEALGVLAESVAGQSLAQSLAQQVLTPLGMHDSFYSPDAQQLSASAVGYDATDKPLAPYRTSTPPSGELYASARDLARFALFQLQGNHPDKALQFAANEARSVAFSGPRGISTTFGWFTGKLSNGDPYFFKGGGQPGVATKIFFLPSADVGCVVLSNRTDAMPLVEECCQLILRKYVPDFTIPEEDAGPGELPFTPQADLVGSWHGRLTNGGANQVVNFRLFGNGTADLALSNRPPEAVMGLYNQMPGFEGTSQGLVDCDHAASFGTRTLVLKLIPSNGRLLGRVTARGTRPGLLLANIPYVVSLERS